MNHRFLIVDDEPGIQNLIKLILQPLAHCVMASNGAEAVRSYQTALDQQRPFSLIILDIMMPILDGLQALEKIRVLEKERGINEIEGVKVIMLTASDATPDILNAFRFHSDAYLIKPFDQEQLLLEIKKLGLIN